MMDWPEALLDAQLLLWREFLPAWCAALTAALTLPLIGTQMAFRGQALVTLAMPQASFAAMAIALALPWLGSADEPSVAVTLGAAFVGALLGGLAASRGAPALSALRMGAVFVLAWATTEVARTLSPVGETQLEPLLHGELLGATRETAGIVTLLLLPAFLVLLQQRRLVFCAAFPDAAQAAGYSVANANRLLALLVAAAVTLGTVALGPLVTTAFLLLPAAQTARRAPSARAMLLRSVVCAVLAALTGSVLSVLADIPLGAAIAVVCVPAGLALRLFR
jgi:ABC-type Mn2+/Zn2+ transport system permease subunit